MSRLSGVSAEIATAFRAVRVEFDRLSPEHREAVDLEWSNLDREVELACALGDRDRAVRAIEEWREGHLAAIREVRS